MPANFISVSFQQRAHMSTAADPAAALSSSGSLQAAATATTSSNLAKFGRAKWAILGTSVLAVGTATVLHSMQPDESARAAQAKAKADTDRRYQELLNSYGSGENLDDLRKAVEGYEGGKG